MSSDCQREATLQEWVERLPEMHSARREYAALVAKVEKITSTTNARGEMLPDFCQYCGLPLLDHRWCHNVDCRLSTGNTSPFA
jgi:hypothetical protein